MCVHFSPFWHLQNVGRYAATSDQITFERETEKKRDVSKSRLYFSRVLWDLSALWPSLQCTLHPPPSQPPLLNVISVTFANPVNANSHLKIYRLRSREPAIALSVCPTGPAGCMFVFYKYLYWFPSSSSSSINKGNQTLLNKAQIEGNAPQLQRETNNKQRKIGKI